MQQQQQKSLDFIESALLLEDFFNKTPNPAAELLEFDFTKCFLRACANSNLTIIDLLVKYKQIPNPAVCKYTVWKQALVNVITCSFDFVFFNKIVSMMDFWQTTTNNDPQLECDFWFELFQVILSVTFVVPCMDTSLFELVFNRLLAEIGGENHAVYNWKKLVLEQMIYDDYKYFFFIVCLKKFSDEEVYGKEGERGEGIISPLLQQIDFRKMAKKNCVLTVTEVLCKLYPPEQLIGNKYVLLILIQEVLESNDLSVLQELFSAKKKIVQWTDQDEVSSNIWKALVRIPHCEDILENLLDIFGPLSPAELNKLVAVLAQNIRFDLIFWIRQDYYARKGLQFPIKFSEKVQFAYTAYASKIMNR